MPTDAENIAITRAALCGGSTGYPNTVLDVLGRACDDLRALCTEHGLTIPGSDSSGPSGPYWAVVKPSDDCAQQSASRWPRAGANHSARELGLYAEKLAAFLRANLPVTPPAPPAAPTGLTAAPDDEAGAVTLGWADATGATGYRVYRDGALVDSPTGSSATDAPAPGTYVYSVAATNAAGQGPASGPVQATLGEPPAPLPPPAPTGLTATPDAAAGTVTLDWDDTAGADSYVVYRGTVPVAEPVASGHVDSPAPGNYSYVVAAVNAAGEGDDSAAAPVTLDEPPQPPGQPTNLAGTPDTAAGTVTLDWGDVPGAEHYDVYRGNDLAGSPTTSSLVDEPAPGTYDYTVDATNSAGTGPRSDVETITLDAPAAYQNRPAQPAAIYTAWDNTDLSAFEHPGALVDAGRIDLGPAIRGGVVGGGQGANPAFPAVAAAGGTVIAYIDPIIDNDYGIYHQLLHREFDELGRTVGPATARWPGEPQANQWGYLADFRPGSVVQQKFEAVLEKIVEENPFIGGFHLDDVGTRSWYPDFSWDAFTAQEKADYRAGAIALCQTARTVCDRHGLMFVVNGTWNAGNGGGYPDAAQHGCSLTEGGMVEHHDLDAFWTAYCQAPQWASATGKPAFMVSISHSSANRDAFYDADVVAFIEDRELPAWGPFHPTGL